MGVPTFTHPHFPAALFDDTHDTRVRDRRADTIRGVVDFLKARGHAPQCCVDVDRTHTFSFL